MNIICPNCRFTRNVAPDRINGRSVIAICPRCGQRFRVVRDATGQECTYEPLPPLDAAAAATPPRASEPSATAQPPQSGDDPLPPGAVIPQDTPDEPAPWHSPKTPESTQEAHDAYRQQARNEHGEQSAWRQEESPLDRPMPADAVGPVDPVDNPWEYIPQLGFFAAFYQTIMRIMFAAPRFFIGLKENTPLMRSLSFYLVVCVLQIVVEQSWSDVISSALSSSGNTDPQLQMVIDMLKPQTNIFMAALLRAAFVTVEIFLIAAVFFVAFRIIAPNCANFQLIFQVLAYSVAPVLLCVVPLIGSVAGFVWSMACTFVGCRYALRLTWSQTVMGLMPLYALGIPVLMILVQSIQQG